MRWASRGQKIPSFRAILLIATELQRLPNTPQSVSDRLLSLFTRTSAEKVRLDKSNYSNVLSVRREWTFWTSSRRRPWSENPRWHFSEEMGVRAELRGSG